MSRAIPYHMLNAGAEAICLPSAWHTGDDSDPQRAAALSTAHSVLQAVLGRDPAFMPLSIREAGGPMSPWASFPITFVVIPTARVILTATTVSSALDKRAESV